MSSPNCNYHRPGCRGCNESTIGELVQHRYGHQPWGIVVSEHFLWGGRSHYKVRWISSRCSRETDERLDDLCFVSRVGSTSVVGTLSEKENCRYQKK
jgi:hypothetical protein